MTAAGRLRFAALDSWRGLAALGVAFHHVSGTAPLLANPFHDNLSRGVDFFFVLSGFVIAFSYGDRLARGYSMARFLLLRWGRIWPLHAAMVLAYLVLECGLLAAWPTGGPGGGPGGRIPFTGPRDLAALPASLLLVQDWIWPGRDLWNVQSWSVSVELALYIVAALAWRALGRRALALGAGFALALGLADLGGAAPLPDHFLRGLIGFGLGMGCWALWPRLAPSGPARGVGSVMPGLVELGLVVVVVILIARDAPLLPLDLAFAAMVLVFAREQGALSALLRTAPLRWLGVLSYGLYMVHGLVFGRIFDGLALAQQRLGGQWVAAAPGGEALLLLPALPSALLVAVMMAVALACAWLAGRLIEWPARNLSRRIAGSMGRLASVAA
ncbi:acyltransferase family protein [Novosphingobium bradum]|uniref:Acyltransferase family protein n=2 Tax=Novosphingobium bradum TaxID=1737444 RepID=A0ABV7IPI1_9SPHN